MGRAPTAAKAIRKKNDREIPPQKKRPWPVGCFDWCFDWWPVILKAGRGVSPLQGLALFFAKHSQGDALGFRMAPRWGLGHCAASELGKGVICVAGLEFKGERPCDEPRLPSPNRERSRDEPRFASPNGADAVNEPCLSSPNGATCESPGHRPRSYTQVIGRGFAKLRTSHGGA